MAKKLVLSTLKYKHFALMEPEIGYRKGSILIELYCEVKDGVPHYFMCIDKKDVYEVSGGQYQLWKDQYSLRKDKSYNADMAKACLAKAKEHKELSKFFMDAYRTYSSRAEEVTDE